MCAWSSNTPSRPSSNVSNAISVRTAFRLHRPLEGVLDKDGESEWGALLAAAQQGDGAAYRAFLRSVLPFIRAIARRRAWSEDMAEDVVQDVLLTVHRVR